VNDIRQIAFTNELRFARAREQVFEAFIQSEKWFQVSYGEERLQRIVLERRVGGQIYEDWGDNAGVLYGTIGWWDPPAGYATVSSMLGGGIVLNHRYEFDEDDEATILRHRFSAFGPISDEMAAGIQWHGSLETWDEQLHAWIERGEVIAPPEYAAR
jgi:hypothetical protein